MRSSAALGCLLFAAAPALSGEGRLRFDLVAYERPRLVAEADSVLGLAPRTIVEAVNPRSAGGPHDWSSEADYFWPDPLNPRGPYVNRDGMTNPGNFVAHRELMLRFARAFDALAAAYLVTRDEKYADAAARHLRAWFVDPATRMNPSLTYSQAIRGLNTGRSIGIIDTVHLAEVALGVEALRGSGSLPGAEESAVDAWFRDYLLWIRTSPFGVAEGKTANNHGTCWALQEAAFAHLLGDREALADARRRFETVFLPSQMAADGSFPKELQRTKPYGYSIFNLDVLCGLAVLLSSPREDLMLFSLADGRSPVRGVEFMAPFVQDKSAWPGKPDVMYWGDLPVRQPFLLFGALSAGRQDWLETWKSLDPDPQVEEVRRNYPIRQPILWIRAGYGQDSPPGGRG